jgi:hypothetical protein
MRGSWKLWALIAGLGLARATLGCSGGTDSRSSHAEQAGTLSVALTGSTPAGGLYHLSNAVFEVTNPFASPPVDLVVSGNDSTLTVDLAASVFSFDYQIVLRDGWTLSAVNPDGTETPLSATLLTNFISFTIKPQRTTPINFQFKASELVVTTGNGSAAVSVAVDDTLIDDFEDGDGQIAPLGGRRGFWFTFNDGTGTQTPAAGTPVLPQVLDTSANFLLHTTGSGFASLNTTPPDGGAVFGAGVGTNLLVDSSGTVRPYNASAYSGINFTFFTRSSPNFPLQVSFFVATSATTPVDEGGTCTMGCFDDFGFVGFVSGGQSSFSGGFSWGDLRQQGFGTPAVFDPATIVTLKWIVAFPNFGQSATDNAFDFQLDDVAFRAGIAVNMAAAANLDAGVLRTGSVGLPDAQSTAQLGPLWSTR